MERNDKGFSLVELIVVIAMMAVALTVSSLSLSNITLANAKKCAAKLQSNLELIRVESTRRVSGDAPILKLYREDGDIYLKAGESEAEVVGNSSVTVKYRIPGEASFTELIDKDEGGAVLQFSYVKSTGGFATLGAEKILVSGANREYNITLYKNTGKVKMD